MSLRDSLLSLVYDIECACAAVYPCLLLKGVSCSAKHPIQIIRPEFHKRNTIKRRRQRPMSRGLENILKV